MKKLPFPGASVPIISCCKRLPLSPAYSQFLGISLLPGCRFKNIKRNLQKDIDELNCHGVLDVFVLCTKGEHTKYRVPHLMEKYQNYGITVHHHPISDGSTPDIARCCVILNELKNCLENKQKIIVTVVIEDLDDPVSQYNYLHDFQETLATYLATEREQPRSVSQ